MNDQAIIRVFCIIILIIVKLKLRLKLLIIWYYKNQL